MKSLSLLSVSGLLLATALSATAAPPEQENAPPKVSRAEQRFMKQRDKLAKQTEGALGKVEQAYFLIALEEVNALNQGRVEFVVLADRNAAAQAIATSLLNANGARRGYQLLAVLPPTDDGRKLAEGHQQRLTRFTAQDQGQVLGKGFALGTRHSIGEGAQGGANAARERAAGKYIEYEPLSWWVIRIRR